MNVECEECWGRRHYYKDPARAGKCPLHADPDDDSKPGPVPGHVLGGRRAGAKIRQKYKETTRPADDPHRAPNYTGAERKEVMKKRSFKPIAKPPSWIKDGAKALYHPVMSRFDNRPVTIVGAPYQLGDASWVVKTDDKAARVVAIEALDEAF